MQFSSVFCLVGVLQLVRSVHIELRYNKPECGPYGFRCLNDRMFEICAEFKRSDDYFSNGEDKLYPPIGSKALCPEGRECDRDNPLYCTSEREERYSHLESKHKACNAHTTTAAPSCEDDDEDEDEDDEDSSQCHTEAPCDKHNEPPIVFDESKSKGAHAGAHTHDFGHTHSHSQGAEASTYEIHGKAPCDKHAHKVDTGVCEESCAQGAHDALESSCDNPQPEEAPPVVFDESNSQLALNSSCDNAQTSDEANSNCQDQFQSDSNDDSCSGDEPDKTSTLPPEMQPSSSCSYRCIRAGNYPDPKDSSKYFFCDINNKGDGFVASHKSCRCDEVFNSALRECIPIENLHADTKRHAEHSQFKCVKCGDFPDPNDCHKYYHCEKSHNGCKQYTLSELCCPDGTRFIKHLKRCGCISPEHGDEKREISKKAKRCGAEPPCPSPPNNCIVVMSTPEPSSCGSCDDDEYEEGPQLPDSEPDSSDGECTDQCGDQGGDQGGDQCGDQCGDQGGDQCGNQCGGVQPVVVCPSHPPINLPKTHHFNCHGEGKFADPYNCTTFFVCHPKRAQGGFQKLAMSCPVGEVFDQSLQKCVPSHG